MDFGGPYPDGHYNLGITDKRTRFPVVDVVYCTSAKSTKEKLKKVFSTQGTREQIETDNGPPFILKVLVVFAQDEVFKNHRFTPLHPLENVDAENFMKLPNRMAKYA